ncbi:MAG: methylenetetrahydrofolate reductase C-terminal domain-containing protein [Atribacterota bacterium]|jgi:ferredoxin|nr:methylenetetrahydrofolate reductase C-terminal domain-containing protein [Atribacterota bacterium]
MIIAKRKPLKDILKMIENCKKILLVGCGTCVTVCSAGGEKEVGILSSLIKIAFKKEGKSIEIIERTVKRQCEKEFIEEIKEEIVSCDAVLSMACGIGVQAIADIFEDVSVYPALDTTFDGMPEEQGVWVELCSCCGNCVLDKTGGVCPITRCAKSLLNGPCGGSQDGMCEVNEDTPCAWQLIYDRLKKQGKLDLLTEIEPIRDWSTSKSGGVRKIIREDLKL